MTYLALSLIPLQAEKIEAYRVLSSKMAPIWLEHGARSYDEHVADDLDVADSGAVPFPKVLGLNEGETLVVATMTFDSREHRDDVQAKVMQDPRVGELFASGPPFDPSRMVHGGFEGILEGGAS